MVEYNKLKVGDKLRITGVGAPGFAKLGDIVTVEKAGPNRCDVVHDVTGERVYFALTCGAARLEPAPDERPYGEMQPVADELLRRMRAAHEADETATVGVGQPALDPEKDR